MTAKKSKTTNAKTMSALLLVNLSGDVQTKLNELEAQLNECASRSSSRAKSIRSKMRALRFYRSVSNERILSDDERAARLATNASRLESKKNAK